MMSSATQSKRERGAEAARQAILDAAEKVFAEHGFDGARVDAIAVESSYNKSLLFQYFDNKLNLYAEVLKRADAEMGEMQARLFAPLFEDESIGSNAYRLRPFLESVTAAVFDYLMDHPRLVRILLWEMAEGWQTYAKIFSQINTEDLSLFERLFKKAHSAGLLRSDFAPLIQLTLLLQICQSYLAFLPLYQSILPGEDLDSPAALARARKYIVDLVVSGIIKDFPETKP